jgi:hypothetical protein
MTRQIKNIASFLRTFSLVRPGPRGTEPPRHLPTRAKGAIGRPETWPPTPA